MANIPALVVQTSFDTDADGILDRITSDTYSAESKILKSVLDSDADGQANAVTSYTYNDSGQQTGLFLDNANDGSVDYSFTTDYTTDTNGVLTVTATSTKTDPLREEVYISKFDREGNLIEETEKRFGEETQITRTYSYNASGQVTTGEFKNSSSEEFLPNFEYTYNALGQVTAYLLSNLRIEYGYDALGRASSTSLTIGDNTIFTYSYTYDKAGNVIRQEDLSVGQSSVETYTYDEQNRLVESNLNGVSLSDGGSFSNQIKYEYNASGQITSYSTSRGDRGEIQNASYEYEYDESGNLIRESSDGFAFGSLSPGGVIEYSYDDAGRITSWRIDNADTDGIFDSVTTYAYDDLLTGGVGQTLSVIAESSSAIESNLFADDFIAQASLGTSDMFSSSELIGGDLLETSTFLEAEADVAATDQFLM